MKSPIPAALLVAITLLPVLPGCSTRQAPREGTDLPYLDKSFELDVRWGASPKTVMLRLFQMADLRESDVFYDLGCGDGRVVVEAARMFGLRGKGVDIDPARIIQSRERAAKAGVAAKTLFLNESFFDTDITDATVVFAFLNNTLNKQLRPRFLRLLKPGTRVIMHTHDMGDWQPDISENVKCECIHNGKLECYRTARFFVVPANATGTWRWNEGFAATMKVRQKFQKVAAEVSYGAGAIAARDARLRGEEISFEVRKTAGGKQSIVSYRGTVKDGAIRGTIVEKGGASPVTREWKATREPSTWAPIDL